ncbi:MAG: tetratricopeptide repeat protein [Gammaproteobacteria bacterium]|nr:tetratricopeptide repeat protein [Gammaproteobacteria bacterium]
MMRYLPLMICAAVTGCATAPTTQPGDYSELYSGRPQTVFATEVPPDSAQAALRSGDAALAEGDIDRAMYHYIHSLELDDSGPDAFYRLGAIHTRRSNNSMALRALQYALERDPEHAAALEETGLIMLKQQRLEQARDYLQRAVTSAPDRARAHVGLGIVADLLGNHDLATSKFEVALTLQPQSADIFNNLGYSRYLAGDWDAAERHYREALRIDAKHAPAVRNLALVQVRRGNHDSALALLRQASTPAEASNDVGYLCMLDGRHECAERYLQQATALSPSYYALAHDNLARNRSRATRKDPAKAGQYIGGSTSIVKVPVVSSEPIPVPAENNAFTTPANDEDSLVRRYVLADVLNVRARSNETGIILDRLPRGRAVQILRREGDWAYVMYWNDDSSESLPHRGWVHESFLSEQLADA